MKAGFWFGYSQASMMIIMGGLQLIQAWLLMYDPIEYYIDETTNQMVVTGGINGADLGTCFFVVLFGVMNASSMGALGPDTAAAITGGSKIFKIVDEPSKVDAVSDNI